LSEWELTCLSLQPLGNFVFSRTSLEAVAKNSFLKSSGTLILSLTVINGLFGFLLQGSQKFTGIMTLSHSPTFQLGRFIFAFWELWWVRGETQMTELHFWSSVQFILILFNVKLRFFLSFVALAPEYPLLSRSLREPRSTYIWFFHFQKAWERSVLIYSGLRQNLYSPGSWQSSRGLDESTEKCITSSIKTLESWR
jgi:hypothetical protein